jgi:outer membrane lipoprotein SlyB
MKRIVAALVSVALCGCVSQQNMKALSDNQAACTAGNQDACTAAGYQAQANQQEQQANATVAASIGAALLGGALAGATIASQRNYGPPVYVVGPPRFRR